MAKALTLQEKIRMAEIYQESGLKAPNSKSFNKYRSAWHKQKIGR